MKLLYDTSKSTILKSLTSDYVIDGKPAPLPAGVVVFERVAVPQPEHNPLTHTITPTTSVNLDNGTYTMGWIVDEKPVDEVKSALLQRIAERRLEIETGGVPYLGRSFKTDPASQAKVGFAYIHARSDPTFTTAWKDAAGVFLAMNNAEVVAFGETMFGFVALCFQREEQLQSLVNAASTIEDLSNLIPVIEAFWG